MDHNLKDDVNDKNITAYINDEKENGAWDKLSDSDLQKLIESVIKGYVERLEQKSLEPLQSHHSLPQTEAMIFINRLLECVDVELFELQMFKNFCQ